MLGTIFSIVEGQARQRRVGRVMSRLGHWLLPAAIKKADECVTAKLDELAKVEPEHRRLVELAKATIERDGDVMLPPDLHMDKR